MINKRDIHLENIKSLFDIFEPLLWLSIAESGSLLPKHMLH